jgi:2-C-methyl-D-erythritol 4-phosphate cytidylyltransferase
MISVILLMAGTGSRMNMSSNKVLLKLGDKPVFKHSYDKFKKNDLEVICVINSNDEEEIKSILGDTAEVVFGGATRQESVYNGLIKCNGDYVLIHDAARPLISDKLIKELIINSKMSKPILTYFKCKNTVKDISDGLKTLNRDNIIFAATPQCAKKEELLYCHQKAKIDNFIATDDISLIEKYLDKEVLLIESNEENFKITTKLDYDLAKVILKEKEND